MFFFFKQKTAYEMRISDWSSDVCSSDLVESEALVGAVGQPLIEAEAVAFRLGDLLAVFVEEHLVVEAFGRAAAEHARDFRRLGDRIDQILARHLVIDPERDPAHRPIDLRSEEHTSELQSLMRISYAVFCLKKNK